MVRYIYTRTNISFEQLSQLKPISTLCKVHDVDTVNQILFLKYKWNFWRQRRNQNELFIFSLKLMNICYEPHCTRMSLIILKS